MMFNGRFPQFLACAMCDQMKIHSRFELLEFGWTNFDIEFMVAIRNFQNFRPYKTIDAKSINNKEKKIRYSNNIKQLSCVCDACVVMTHSLNIIIIEVIDPPYV